MERSLSRVSTPCPPLTRGPDSSEPYLRPIEAVVPPSHPGMPLEKKGPLAMLVPLWWRSGQAVKG